MPPLASEANKSRLSLSQFCQNMTDMNYEKQKTADLHEYLRNFPVESWSAYFIRFNQFLYSPQCQDFNCHLSVLWIYFSASEFPLLCVIFFVNLKTVTYIPLWHPARTNRSYSSLSMGAESGKKKVKTTKWSQATWLFSDSHYIPVGHPQTRP